MHALQTSAIRCVFVDAVRAFCRGPQFGAA